MTFLAGIGVQKVTRVLRAPQPRHPELEFHAGESGWDVIS